MPMLIVQMIQQMLQAHHLRDRGEMMKGYFTEPGKYKNYIKVEKVSIEDVKAKKIFDIYDKNAQSFCDAGKFVIEGMKNTSIKAETKAEVKEEKKEQKKK